jgi:hypothetical protein
LSIRASSWNGAKFLQMTCHNILDTIVALAQRSFGAAYQFVPSMNSESSRKIPRTSGAGCGIR